MIGVIIFVICLYVFFGIFGGEYSGEAWKGLTQFILGIILIGISFVGIVLGGAYLLIR